MDSVQLLSKQGPLAHVWLAANYEKKLSKQQLLNTNIIASSKYISTQPRLSQSQSQNQEQDQSQQSGKAGTITLRLSGQLLLGIVRIYSRKTKYLLDDVNDTLFKLKNSFKYATGGNILLGSDNTNNPNINLPPQKTIITNVSNIILTDQATDFDLLYQEDLNLDDDTQNASTTQTLFSQLNNSVNNDDSFNYDQSIEYPRYDDVGMGMDDGVGINNNNEDFDLELDFNLDDEEDVNDGESDRSIEVGRNAPSNQVTVDHPDISLVDFNEKQENNDQIEFDFGNPLETIDELHQDTNVAQEPLTPPSQPEQTQKRPRKATTGITENGELRTNKRKIAIDSVNDIESGISSRTLRDIQQQQMSNEFGEEFLIVTLSESDKLQLIHELSTPVSLNNKRRKLWNVDDHLQRECLRLSEEEKQKEQEKERELENQQWDQENDFNNDFDLSLPGLESDYESPQNFDSSIPLEELANENEEFEEEHSKENSTKASIQIAGHLRDAFTTKNNITNLSELIQKDLNITKKDFSSANPESLPLGTVHHSSDSINVNQRREATKCFFELLVLASQDCITLDQRTSEDKRELGGEISITSRDKLFSSFL